MRLELRTRLLLAAVLPPLGVAAAAPFAAPGVTAGAAAAAAAAAGAAVLLLTRNVDRLRDSAAAFLRRLDRVMDGETAAGGFPIDARDGTEKVAQALTEAEGNLVTWGRLTRRREADLRELLARTTQALAAAAEARVPPPLALPELTCPEEGQAMVAAVNKLAYAHAAAARRANAYLCVLQDVPDPLLVLDAKTLDVTFRNAAAERFYAHLPAAGRRTPFDACFARPAAAAVPEHDAPAQAGPDALREWLVRGSGGTRVGAAGGPNGQTVPVEVAVAPQFERRSSHFVTALLRDLTASQEAEAASRRRQRQLVGQRLCRLLSRESRPALGTMRTQTNLLSQAAKQIGQRDRLLPKVRRIVEEVCRQELVVDLLDWMGMLSANQVGDPEVTEVRIGDAARAVGDRLRPGFEERGNTLEVADDAGWVLTDEAWVTALVTGLLAHANQACERATVRLTLGRRSAVQALDEYAVVAVDYPGKPLPPHLADDVRDPYRRPDSAVFDPDRPGGLLLGLAVAHKLAGLMYGEFTTDAGPEGRVVARVVVPTRIGKPRAAETANPAAAADPAAETEAIGAWTVGGAAATEATDDDDLVAIVTPPRADAPPDEPPSDETLGNWFRGPGD